MFIPTEKDLRIKMCWIYVDCLWNTAATLSLNNSPFRSKCVCVQSWQASQHAAAAAVVNRHRYIWCLYVHTWFCTLSTITLCWFNDALLLHYKPVLCRLQGFWCCWVWKSEWLDTKYGQPKGRWGVSGVRQENSACSHIATACGYQRTLHNQSTCRPCDLSTVCLTVVIHLHTYCLCMCLWTLRMHAWMIV